VLASQAAWFPIHGNSSGNNWPQLADRGRIVGVRCEAGCGLGCVQ
jgi:hypothetical protein